ncbi:MAG: type II secretion system F family protein [Patescibacteria group bacterium]|jgi:type IV pilus assembly protein PilC|nr:type II secretion system F family protein [Patescibacteria group bacterium]
MNTRGGNKKIKYFGRLNLSDKSFFVSNLSMMLRSGLSIVESLDVIGDQSRGLLKIINQDISDSVSAGNSLAESFTRHPKIFSNLFISIVRAGELSGSLEENLSNLGIQLEKEKELSDKIKNAMVYPGVVLAMSFILGIGLSIFVLPKITPIFEGLRVDLPASTRFLISFSNYVENNIILFLIQTFGSLVFLTWLLRQKFIKPISHLLVLYTPLVKNISHYSNIARFSRTLSSLLKSGISIDEALLVTSETLNNIYYKNYLKEISLKVSGGNKLSEAMAEYEKYFSKLSLSMIRVAEKAGSLEETLEKLAQINEAKLDQATKRISVLIEPFLLIFVGLIVGWLAISIISPIYQITGSVYK